MKFHAHVAIYRLVGLHANRTPLSNRFLNVHQFGNG